MAYKDKEKEREYKRNQMRRRRAEDPERFRATLRRSYALHRERRLADSSKWRNETPERGRASYLVSGAKKRAASKGLDFNLSFDWALRKITYGRCEATGVAFECKPPCGGAIRSPWAPSVDRINPRLGYTEDNCRMVVWIYNAAKSEFSDADVTKMAEAIVAPAEALKKK